MTIIEPENLSSPANCPYCRGSGWELVHNNGLEQVKRCRCHGGKKRERIFADTRIPLNFAAARLDNFQVYHNVSGKHSINRTLSTPHEVASQFVKNYPAVNKGLFFMGPPGVGKTHLAAAIIAELSLNQGIPCLFCNFQELLKQIQASYDPSFPLSEFSILEPVINKEILVLDDLGAWKVSDWMRDILGYIINQRYDNKRLMVITSNWMDNPRQPEEETLTDRIGSRIRSRLHEMCQEFEIAADDYRKTRKTKFLKSKAGN